MPSFSVRHATNTLRLRASHTNKLQLPLTSAHKHDGTTRSPTVTDRGWFTAALTRTELIRAASRTGDRSAVEHARTILASLDLVALSDRLLDTAATLAPPSLRTLDAIHLAAAMTAGARLDAVITYDERMAIAARDAGLMLAQPEDYT